MNAAFFGSASPAARRHKIGLRLGGLTPLSTTDYPGFLAAVLFCQGCAWRCAYCHNPHLMAMNATPERSWAQALDFLRRRIGLLDAVVFSGGEPTLQEGLAEAVSDARSLGFKIGLHTAGVYPERLAKVLPLVDWVGLDVKAPFNRYAEVNGAPGSAEKVWESLRRLVASGVDHECRTTVHPFLFTAEELAALSETLFALGARRHAIQAFRPNGCADAVLVGVSEIAVARLIDETTALAPRVERR